MEGMSGVAVSGERLWWGKENSAGSWVCLGRVAGWEGLSVHHFLVIPGCFMVIPGCSLVIPGLTGNLVGVDARSGPGMTSGIVVRE